MILKILHSFKYFSLNFFFSSFDILSSLYNLISFSFDFFISLIIFTCPSKASLNHSLNSFCFKMCSLMRLTNLSILLGSDCSIFKYSLSWIWYCYWDCGSLMVVWYWLYSCRPSKTFWYLDLVWKFSWKSGKFILRWESDESLIHSNRDECWLDDSNSCYGLNYFQKSCLRG